MTLIVGYFRMSRPPVLDIGLLAPDRGRCALDDAKGPAEVAGVRITAFDGDIVQLGVRMGHQMHGFFDFQLTDPPTATLTDFFGNRAVAFYLDPAIALRTYQMSPVDRLGFDLLRHVPMVVERAGVWANVEKLRRAMGQVGMPPAETNRFGRAADFALLEARSPDDFAAQCEAGQKADLSQPILQMIADAHAHGAQVVIVEMPMHPYHQTHFYALPAWDQYRDHLRKLVAAQHATYLNAADWIQEPDEFADHLHLAPSGAKDFSRRLAVKIREMNFSSTTAATTPK